METTIKKNPELDAIINNAIAPMLSQNDYYLRKELLGCGFTASAYARQFHPVGTEEFKYLCINLTDKLSAMLKKSYENTRDFKIEIEYKSKSKENVFGYSCTETERTKEEAMQRVKERKFYDLNTGRKIKPVFTKIEIN